MNSHKRRFKQQGSVNFKNERTGGVIELESLIRQCEYLYNSYEERFSILLSEAELRLHENSEATKFQNMEKQMKKHITQWYKMSGDISQIAISSRDHMNTLSVQMQTLTEEIEERDKIIQTERAENANTIQEYENQLKILENVIAKSLPNNMRVQQIQQWMNAGIEEDFQKTTDKMNEDWLRLKHDHKKSVQELMIMRKNFTANAFQRDMIQVNDELARKEKIILDLRFLTQDLAQERNDLEMKLKQVMNDPMFVSVTPSRQMKYELDLSAFLSDDEEKDVAEHGLLMDMDMDVDCINAEVQERMQMALEAVQQVSRFANDRDCIARELESVLDTDKEQKWNVLLNDMPINRSITTIDENEDTVDIIDERQKEYEQTLKLREIINIESMIEQLGSFDAYRKYTFSDNEKHYRLMLKELEKQLSIGCTHGKLLQNCISDIIDEDVFDIELSSYKTSSTISKNKLKELQTYAQKMVDVMDDVVTEFAGAEQYIHPDHKKVEILKQHLKELELTMPYLDTKKLAVLSTIPKYLNHVLQRIKSQKPKRIRNAEQEMHKIIEMNKKRHKTFEWCLQACTSFASAVIEKSSQVKKQLRENNEQSFGAYVQQIDIAMDSISEFTIALQQEFMTAKDFVHPSHIALMNCAYDLVNTQLEYYEVNKRYSMLQGEYKAVKEELAEKPKIINVSDLSVLKNEHSKINDIELDFMKFAETFETSNTPQVQFKDDSSIANIVPTMSKKLDLIKTHTHALHKVLKDVGRGIVQLSESKIEPNHYSTQWGTGGRRNSDLDDTEIDVHEFLRQAVHQLEDIIHTVKAFDIDMNYAKEIIGPQSKYTTILERRYQQIYGLFQMKIAEVETQRDLVEVREQAVEHMREEIDELNIRLGSVMSSAMSSTEIRLQAFNGQHIKLQTFAKVAKLVEDTYVNVQQACEDIQESVEKDLFEIIGDSYNEKQQIEIRTMNENVCHACEYILKAFDDIGQEMDGVQQFVHPDRQLVEKLQQQILQFYHQADMDENNNEAGGIMIHLNSASSNKRRDSIAEFKKQFVEAEHLQNHSGGAVISAEVRKRKRESYSKNRRRRSSLSGIVDCDGRLLPVAAVMKADSWTGVVSDAPMDDDDREKIQSLLNSMRTGRSAIPRCDYTPATSPEHPMSGFTEQQATPIGNNEEDLSLAVQESDIVSGHSLYNNAAPFASTNAMEQQQQNMISKDIVNNMRVEMESDMDDMRKTLEDKDLLIEDLQRQMGAMRDTRTAEIENIQHNIKNLRLRCRGWYDSILYRVSETEKAYHNKILILNQDKQKEKNELRMNLKAAKNSNAVDLEFHEELKRENSRLNADLERYKQKYFDAEQKKIELQDLTEEKLREYRNLEQSLEESVQAYHKTYDELQDIKEKYKSLSESKAREDNSSGFTGVGGAEEMNDEKMHALNDEKNNLEMKLQQQQREYEEEFREFERMANEKVVQLEEYYMQQIRIKEIEAQQLEQKLIMYTGSSTAPTSVSTATAAANNMQQMLMVDEQQQQYLLLQQKQQQTESECLEYKHENKKLDEMIHTLKDSNNRLSEQLQVLKSRFNPLNEELKKTKILNVESDNKLSAYKESFLDLAQKLKDITDISTKYNRKFDKLKTKYLKMEKKKKKLKTNLRLLKEKIENLTAVTTELVSVKHTFKQQQIVWKSEEEKYVSDLNEMQDEIQSISHMKVQTTNRYAMEFNHLRTIIKQMNDTNDYLKDENERLRDVENTDSVMGQTIAYLAPSNWMWSNK